MCVQVCTCAHVFKYVHVRACSGMYMCVCVQECACACVFRYVHVCVFRYVHVCSGMYMCMCVQVWGRDDIRRLSLSLSTYSFEARSLAEPKAPPISPLDRKPASPPPPPHTGYPRVSVTVELRLQTYMGCPMCYISAGI